MTYDINKPRYVVEVLGNILKDGEVVKEWLKDWVVVDKPNGIIVAHFGKESDAIYHMQAMNDIEFIEQSNVADFVDGINEGCFVMTQKLPDCQTTVTWLTPHSGWPLEIFMRHLELGERAARTNI